jgi:pSer/pThr/pTyr-binding forkhead associated (FHA) protein
MLHLVVTLRDRAVGRFDLTQERVRIGRSPENEVQIDSMAVSRTHCVIERVGDGWVVDDLGSNNGTFVNGARVTGKAPVRDGDALMVGKFQVSFRTSQTGTGSGRVPLLPPSSPPGRSPGLLELAAEQKAFLILVNRPGPPVLVERDALTFGSAPGADVPIDGPPRRAVLVRGHGGFQVLCTAAEPLVVAGVPVPDRAWLQDGVEVTAGELRFTFHMGRPEGNEQTVTVQVPPGGWVLPGPS